MSNAQDNAAHTCSYSCDRPECIKAQRDELAAGREAQRDQDSANAEYLAYLEAAVDEAGFVIKHDGGTLGDSNFRLEPKTQPAVAQEAVGEVADWDGSLCVQWVPNYEPPAGTKLYAATVTAALAGVTRDEAEQVIDRIMGEYGFSMPSRAYAELVDEFMCTPAAPGIDLRQFRDAVVAWSDKAYEESHNPEHPTIQQADRLLALIDASPKGSLNKQLGSAEGLDSHASMEAHYRQALERIASQGPHYGPDGTRETWQHWCDIARDALADSPKGGSEARDAERYRKLRRMRINPYAVLPVGDALDVHVDAMKAQAGGAEVQP